jgi:PhnB protein
MFYGARSARVHDPFGHVWMLVSWEKDLDRVEMKRRGKEFLGR